MRSRSDDVEFWSRVEVQDVRDCWRWLGTQQGNYGAFRVAATGEQVAAHRYAWSFIYGPIPTGLNVLHSCDRGWCVNPRHLRIGTHEDNTLDKSAVSRVRAVLSEARQAEEDERANLDRIVTIAQQNIDAESFQTGMGAIIKRLRLAAGLTQSQLARLLGVSPAAVCQWETGVSGIAISRISSIARTLDVEIAELLK